MAEPLTGYREALDFLFARTTGASRLGLERTRALLAALGDPHAALRTLHIAGTNGKGSVAATLESLLRGKGLRVGKYTSPHLVDFRERILIDGEPMPGEAVVEFIGRALPAIENTGATFFEATTVMALEHLARAGVDIAVIETGLGGRLDATNVVQPLVAAVTTIGIDHTEYLGDTLESIAAEKAGIFKPGVPAVIGEPSPAIAADLERRARLAGVPSVRKVGRELLISDVEVGPEGTSFVATWGTEPATRNEARGTGQEGRGTGDERRDGSRRDHRLSHRVPHPSSLVPRPSSLLLRTPLIGVHQAANAAVALLMLDAAGPELSVPLAEAEESMSRVTLSGRFQRLDGYILDVAHNPDGMRVVVDTLAAVRPTRPLVALLCVLGDKDWRTMIDELGPRVDLMVITQAPTAPASRAWDPAAAGAFAAARGFAAEVVVEFEAAMARAREAGATVLVTGSFHTVGDALARLQRSPVAG